MPFIKKKEYDELKEELVKLRTIKKHSSWQCSYCEKIYYGLRDFYLFNGEKWVCDYNFSTNIIKGAILSFKMLNKNYLIDNISKSIMGYVFGVVGKRIMTDDEDVKRENIFGSNGGRYCLEKYENYGRRECSYGWDEF